MTATNIGTPTVSARGFVPLAVEAGIVPVITSLLSGLSIDVRTLLLGIKSELADTNPELSQALNIDNLAAILTYAEKVGGLYVTSALPEVNAPEMIDEDGPISVSAARDGGTPTQVNISFSEYPVGYKYEIYLDGVYQKTGEVDPVEGWVNELLSGVTEDGQNHTIRVLFLDEVGGQTRFGPIANFT